jgi:hypothetical protein
MEKNVFGKRGLAVSQREFHENEIKQQLHANWMGRCSMMREYEVRILKKAVVIGAVLLAFCAGFAFSGDLEPPAAPDSTMHTLEEIHDLILEIDGGIPKTGQIVVNSSQDDGDLQRGKAWPGPRFTINPDGTVTDNLTKLIWLQEAQCFGLRNWNEAISDANTLNSGECGLSDNSVEGDWRLPNVRELNSLIHYGYNGPALPNTFGGGHYTSGDPFENVQFSFYWTSTSNDADPSNSFAIDMDDGLFDTQSVLGEDNYVWPVRDPIEP